jgi:leucyl/phenylalanyl-tRNA--protein transferase
LRRRILQGGFDVAVNRDFAGTLAGCAARPQTWINAQIFDLYMQLHAMGHAHSLEIYQNSTLVGGVYGVALGGAFFGESMFSRQTDASKIALAYLVHRLRAGGFVLFDTQYLTPHLASLGAVEIARHAYERQLQQALPLGATFTPPDYCPSAASVVGGAGSTTGRSNSGTSQRSTQTS